MLIKKEQQHLDDEWIELMQMAKVIGLSREEVRAFFRENTVTE